MDHAHGATFTGTITSVLIDVAPEWEHDAELVIRARVTGADWT